MTSISKPEYCGQDWSEMKPTEGGRICGQCSKVIVDFSRMTWAEIEQKQRENNNSLCGMYSRRQLDNWGREVPTSSCSKLASTAALLISLATSTQVNAQTIANSEGDNRTIVKGRVTGKTDEGSIDTLGFAKIFLKGTSFEAEADEQGNYQIDLTNYIDSIVNPMLVFEALGFCQSELKLSKENKGEAKYDVQLIQGYYAPIEGLGNVKKFYVKRPPLWQRIKRSFKSWFGLKGK